MRAQRTWRNETHPYACRCRLCRAPEPVSPSVLLVALFAIVVGIAVGGVGGVFAAFGVLAVYGALRG